jgi:hypothetical protein
MTEGINLGERGAYSIQVMTRIVATNLFQHAAEILNLPKYSRFESLWDYLHHNYGICMVPAIPHMLDPFLCLTKYF